MDELSKLPIVFSYDNLLLEVKLKWSAMVSNGQQWSAMANNGSKWSEVSSEKVDSQLKGGQSVETIASQLRSGQQITTAGRQRRK